ncbi:MAG: B12-binding domain-containing radical SAM protein [Oligoflexia bacterium]|nr:B12-binding domain-containing radical SAM protein [Oligoflexia bacterium]
MNILAINVSLRPESPVKLFPIGLGFILTTLKKAGIEFDLIDIDIYRYTSEQIENLIQKRDYQVVCLGCIVTGYKTVKELTKLIRTYHPTCTIIAGNSVATSITETLLTKTEVNIAVMGEGDETIIELIRALETRKDLESVKGIAYLKNKAVTYTENRSLIKDISTLPFIDFSMFDIELYIENSKHHVCEPLPISRDEVRVLQVNTARGCVANCGFCYHVFKNAPYRHRSSESIISEIKFLIEKYSINYIQFWDELTFYSKKQTMELVRGILNNKLKFYWVAQCRANLFNEDKDIEIIELMKESGCLGMEYSLESADKDILKSMNKNISVEQFNKQTVLFQKAGITTWTSLVIGYPDETKETLKTTFDCCIQNNMYPSVGYLLPQPGSQMYEFALDHGYIDRKNEEDYFLNLGDRQDLRINMTKMSSDELQSEVKNHLIRCNEVLGIGLDVSKLIKTQYYRGKKEKN